MQEWDKDPDDHVDETLQSAADYEYDVFGNRIQKRVDSEGNSIWEEIERYTYDGWKVDLDAMGEAGSFLGQENWDVYADVKAGGTLFRRYLRGDAVDELFARIEEGTTTDTPYWLLTDRLGSVRDVVDNSGTVKNHIDYDGFGNITSETDSSYQGRYAWTGREIDVETGLQYNRARYYDPTIGRWISQDPLGFEAGDSNLYRYVFNGPTLATDPSGFQRGFGGAGLGNAQLEVFFGNLVANVTEFFAGGRFNRHSDYSYIPSEKPDGVVGGGLHAGTLRLSPIEKNPTEIAAFGQVVGAGSVPILGSAGDLYFGKDVTGQKVNRQEALLWLGADLVIIAPIGAAGGPVKVGGRVRTGPIGIIKYGGRTTKFGSWARHKNFLKLTTQYGRSHQFWQLNKFVCPGSPGFGGSKHPIRWNQQRGYWEVLRPSRGGSGPNRWHRFDPPSSPAHRPVGRRDQPGIGQDGPVWNGNEAEWRNHPLQPTRNPDTTIYGRRYTGHAVDQMQNRGITPSVVENAVQHGTVTPDPIPGRLRHYDATNRIMVVTENGDVITVRWD